MSEPQQPAGWLTAEQAQQMVADALAQHQATAASGSITAEQAQAMIDQALARQAEAHSEQIRQLSASMRGSVVTFIPTHGGGPGDEIAETWSALEQARAIAAEEASRAA